MKSFNEWLVSKKVKTKTDEVGINEWWPFSSGKNEEWFKSYAKEIVRKGENRNKRYKSSKEYFKLSSSDQKKLDNFVASYEANDNLAKQNAKKVVKDSMMASAQKEIELVRQKERDANAWRAQHDAREAEYEQARRSPPGTPEGNEFENQGFIWDNKRGEWRLPEPWVRRWRDDGFPSGVP